jgi:hypothetical protein
MKAAMRTVLTAAVLAQCATAWAVSATNDPKATYSGGQFSLPPLGNPKDAYVIFVMDTAGKTDRWLLPNGTDGLRAPSTALPPGQWTWRYLVLSAQPPRLEVTTPRNQSVSPVDLDDGRIIVGWTTVPSAKTYRIAGEMVDQGSADDRAAWTKFTVDCPAFGCPGGNGFELKPGYQATYKVTAIDVDDVVLAQADGMTASVTPTFGKRAEAAGFKLQRSDTLSKLLAQEPAVFSWNAAQKEGGNRSSSYRSEFAVILEPQHGGYAGWFPRYSFEGALTSSGDQKPFDALRLRAGGYKIWQPNPGEGAELVANLKYETERKSGTKKGMIELAVTPIYGWLGKYTPVPTGPRPRNAIGNLASPPGLVLAPLVTFGLEVGKTFDVGSSAETNDTVLRLKSLFRLDANFPAAAAALRIPQMGASLQATFWRLPKESEKNHALGRASLNFGITDAISFELAYSAGRDAPTFKFLRSTSASFGLKF